MPHTDSPLRRRVREHAENRPGIYRMYGPGGEILYVGKSIKVRTRLLSYFRASPGEKPAELIRETARLDWDYIPDEFGALVQEMRLIQERRPRYNVQHKRKRAYAFVKITAETAPRVLPTTTVAQDGALYYGPFPRVGRVAQTIRDLAQSLGLRDCAGATPMFFADQLDIFGAADRTPLCLRAELGSCLGPCAGRVTAGDYLRRLDEARRFLENRSRTPLHRLQQQMENAAARLDFEYAAILRDRVERLRIFQEELTAFRGHVESLRFIYRARGHGGRDRLYLIRAGRIRDAFPVPRRAADLARARDRIAAAFGGPEAGPGGLSAHDAAEVLLVARYFRLRDEEMRRTLRPEAALARLGRAVPPAPDEVFGVPEDAA
jgi:excinuclease ABC subunit C